MKNESDFEFYVTNKVVIVYNFKDEIIMHQSEMPALCYESRYSHIQGNITTKSHESTHEPKLVCLIWWYMPERAECNDTLYLAVTHRL